MGNSGTSQHWPHTLNTTIDPSTRATFSFESSSWIKSKYYYECTIRSFQIKLKVTVADVITTCTDLDFVFAVKMKNDCENQIHLTPCRNDVNTRKFVDIRNKKDQI